MEYRVKTVGQGPDVCSADITQARWAEQREVAYFHGTHVKDHAVEVEEDALAKVDVRAVVTKEGRLHQHGLAALTKQLG